MDRCRPFPPARHSPPALVLCSLLLAACSGGGGGDGPTDETTFTSPGDPPGLSDGGSSTGTEPFAGVPTIAGADPDDSGSGDSGDDVADGGAITQTAQTGTGGDDPSSSEACSVAGVNDWVDERMRDFYLYADQVPVVDLVAYDDPDELVEDLRVPPDDFSNVADEARQTRRLEEGRRFGFGHWLFPDADDRLRFRRIRTGSPADLAGIERGDVLIEANGVAVRDLTDAQWEAFRGEADVPTRQSMLVRSGTDDPRSIEIESADYHYFTADRARVFERDGVRVAYLSVTAFYETTRGELDAAIEWLAGRDIDELMIDFRYNPGGRSSVARRLAGQLVGADFAGREFQLRRFNSRYSGLDEASLLEAVVPALAMPRVVALVSERTASASESVVNGLQPHIDVTVIGMTTRGKPFTSRPESLCGKTLNAMNAIRTNAAGVSVAGGIAPDCVVEDEFLFPRADERDALTAAGIAFLTTGACPTAPIAGTGRAREHASSSTVGPGGLERDVPEDIDD